MFHVAIRSFLVVLVVHGRVEVDVHGDKLALSEFTPDGERAVSPEALEEQHRTLGQRLGVQVGRCVDDRLVVDPGFAVGRARQDVDRVADQERAGVHLDPAEQPTFRQPTGVLLRRSGFTQGSSASHSGQT